jgi:hypothetical protein
MDLGGIEPRHVGLDEDELGEASSTASAPRSTRRRPMAAKRARDAASTRPKMSSS